MPKLMWKRRLRDLAGEQGATSIEYALLALLIGIAIIVALTALGKEVVVPFNTLKDAL